MYNKPAADDYLEKLGNLQSTDLCKDLCGITTHNGASAMHKSGCHSRGMKWFSSNISKMTTDLYDIVSGMGA